MADMADSSAEWFRALGLPATVQMMREKPPPPLVLPPPLLPPPPRWPPPLLRAPRANPLVRPRPPPPR
jgi:hypothetical protein